MKEVTGEQVKAAMIAGNIARVDHHRCGFCNYMTAYHREGEALYFDPGCNCAGGGGWEPRTWDSAADWINMQSREDVRQRLMTSFGLQSQAA